MRRSMIVLLAALLLMAVAVAPSSARPGQIETDGYAYVVEVVDPGRVWIEGDVWHIRGQVLRSVAVGTDGNADYTNGINRSVVNWNWNLANGAAAAWGTFEITLSDLEGGFFGTWTSGHKATPAAVPGPAFNPTDPTTWPCADWTRGRATGKGFGDLAGAQFRSTLDSSTCGATYTQAATIFFPGK